MTKVLAVLLLIVAGALVFTVYNTRKQANAPQNISFEPRPIAQRPDDKLGADEKSTIDVFKKFSRSVVHITSLESRRDRMTLDLSEIPQGTGSGFVWDTAGHVVTNFHVIQHGNRASVTLQDGSTYPAKIIGKAPDKDLAVLKIDAPAQKLQPLPVGTSSGLEVGQKVLAIGNPFGLDQTLTTGVISGLGREIKSVTQRSIFDVIQTDASINPGIAPHRALDALLAQLDGLGQAVQRAAQRVRVRRRDERHGVAGHVLGDDAPVPVIDDAARRGARHLAQPILLRLQGVLLVLDDLRSEERGRQQADDRHQHDARRPCAPDDVVRMEAHVARASSSGRRTSNNRTPARAVAAAASGDHTIACISHSPPGTRRPAAR
jgi:hypothetical protein